MSCARCLKEQTRGHLTDIPSLGPLCPACTVWGFVHYVVRQELAERRARRLACEHAAAQSLGQIVRLP